MITNRSASPAVETAALVRSRGGRAAFGSTGSSGAIAIVHPSLSGGASPTTISPAPPTKARLIPAFFKTSRAA
jgi:hypothetical protein